MTVKVPLVVPWGTIGIRSHSPFVPLPCRNPPEFRIEPAEVNYYVMDRRAIRRHNQNVLDCVRDGDLLELPRGIYSHWAVYVGNNRVIHLEGRSTDGLLSEDVIVKLDNFWTVVETSLAKVNNYLDWKEKPLNPEEIVERAWEKIGHRGFNLLFTNCEHFVTWCRYNKATSSQVETVDQLFDGIGAVMNGIFGAIAEHHPDQENRENARRLLAVGQVMGVAKDLFVLINNNGELSGLHPGNK